MTNKTTYQQKHKWLLWAVIPILGLTYFLAIAPTLSIFQENKQLARKAALAEAAPQKITLVKAKLLSINKRLGSGVKTEDSNSENTIGNTVDNQPSSEQLLLNEVASYCQRERLRFSIPEKLTHEKSGFQLSTNTIEIIGPFAKTLELIYQLESSEQYGRISSSEFSLVKDRRSKQSELVTRVHIQNLHPIP